MRGIYGLLVAICLAASAYAQQNGAAPSLPSLAPPPSMPSSGTGTGQGLDLPALPEWVLHPKDAPVGYGAGNMVPPRWGLDADKQELAFRCQLAREHPEFATPLERASIAKLWKQVDASLAAFRDSCGPIVTPNDLSMADQVAANESSQALTTTFQLSSYQDGDVTSPSSCPNATLFPWPPPVPTSSAAWDYYHLTRRTGFKTVGDVDRWLEDQLNPAGFTQRKFWGVPGGFAVVTPLEAIDDGEKPIAGAVGTVDDRTSRSFGFSLADFLWKLFSHPVNHSRVFLFILTNDDRADRLGIPVSTMFVNTWKDCGVRTLGGVEQVNGVTPADPLTTSHFFMILVYEFEKNQMISSFAGHRIEQFLRGSNLKLDEQLQ
jgi:hypothetical protein